MYFISTSVFLFISFYKWRYIYHAWLEITAKYRLRVVYKVLLSVGTCCTYQEKKARRKIFSVSKDLISTRNQLCNS